MAEITKKKRTLVDDLKDFRTGKIGDKYYNNIKNANEYYYKDSGINYKKDPSNPINGDNSEGINASNSQNTLGNTAKTNSSNNKKTEKKKKPVIKNTNEFAEFGQNAFENPKQGIKTEKDEKKQQYILDLDNSGGLPSSEEISAFGNAALSPIGKITTEADKYREYENEYKDYSYDQFKSEAEKVDDKADNGWKKKWFDSAIVEKRNEFYSDKYKDYDYKKLKTESSNNKLSDEEREWLKNTADEKATSAELQVEYDSLTKEYNTLYDSRDEESSYNRLKEIEDRQEDLKSLIDKKKYEEKKKAEYDDVIENDIKAKTVMQKYYYLQKYDELNRMFESTGKGIESVKVKSSIDAYNYAKDLTPEERKQIIKDFNSLENKDTLYKYYKREREEQETAEQNQILTDYSEEHPVLGSLASMGLNTYGSIPDTVNYIGAGIDKAFGGDGYINPDSTNVAKAQLMREKVSEDMDGLGKFFYNTGMSIGDNLARMPLLALPGGEAMSLALAGTSAGVSSANDVINSGGSLESALWTGAAAGTAEVVFEKIPLDKLIKLKNEGTDSVFRAVVNQMKTEGLEEVGTDIANAITDQIINGDMSQLALQYQNYIAQGYSEEEARKQIAFDFASQLGQSFAAGAISGGVLSGGTVAINKIGGTIEEKSEKRQSVSQLGREALQSENFDVNELIKTAKKSDNPKAVNLANSLEKVVEEKGADKVKAVDVGNLLTLTNSKEITYDYSQDLSELTGTDKQNIIDSNFELNGEEKTSKTSNNSEVKYTDTKAFGENYPHGLGAKISKTGELINIVGIKSSSRDFNSDDNTVVLLSDKGELYDADDIRTSVPYYNNLFDYAKNFDTIGARVYLSQYEDYVKRSKSRGKTADVAEYSESFERLYSYGIKGVTYDSIKKSGNFTREINILSAGVAYSAVQSGNNDFKVDTRDKSNKSQKIRMPGESNSISSKVYVDPGSEESVKVTDEQLAVLQAVADKTGREIVLTDRMGERTGDENANGGYNLNDGKIYINAEVHDSYMLSVSLHEAVHGVASDNPAEYHALCTFITNYLVAKGENLDDHLRIIKTNWGNRAATDESALEELVCQTVMAIATDEAAIKTALSLEENKGILKKVASALKKIAKAAYDFIKGVGVQAHNKQAQPWIDNIDALNELAVRLEKAFESTRTLNEQRANATANTETAQKNNIQSDVKFSYGGPTAKIANISRLDQAIQMENSGKDSESIRKKIDWFRGMDGKWRFEIDDSKMRFYKATKQDIKNTEEYKNNKIRYNGLSHKIANNTATAEQQQKYKAAEKYIKEYETSKKLSDYVSHPELFRAYPQLKEVNFYFDTISAKGAYYPDGNAIVINPTLSQDEQRESVIHEIQHAIQHIEGFADGSTMAQWQKNGADSLTAYNNYRNTAGEIEARDTANRVNLNSEQRKNTRPDIDRKDVVFAENAKISMDDIKNYELDTYSEREIKNWNSNKNIVIYRNNEQLIRFIDNALNNPTEFKKLYFGKISKNLARFIKKETNIDLTGYNLSLRSYEIRKTLINSHGNEEKENLRGQRAITKEDLIHLPEIITHPDKIELSEKLYENKPVIIFSKTINGKISTATYVSSKHHDLSLQTMYSGKNKESLATTPSGNHSFSQTSETLSGTAFNKSLLQNNNNVKHSVDDVIDENRDLVAVHNLSAKKLAKMISDFDGQGIPAPSIAIDKADNVHSDFGEISLIFDRNTIDPKADRRNSVYSRDAWTSMYPKTEFKLNEKAMKKLAERLDMSVNELKTNMFDTSDIQKIKYRFEDDIKVRKAFLKENNLKATPVLRDRQPDIMMFSARAVKKFVRNNDCTFDRLVNDKEFRNELFKAYSNGASLKGIANAHIKETDEILDLAKSEEFYSVLKEQFDYAIEYAKGNVQRTEGSMSEAVNNAIEEYKEEFDRYIDDLLSSGVLGEEYIVRDDVDPYDEYGNRKPFSKTHYKYNIENVVMAMKAGRSKVGSSFSGGVAYVKSIGAKKLNSIDEIKGNKNKIVPMTEAELEAENERISDLIKPLIQVVADSGSYNNDFITASNNIVDAFNSKKDVNGVYNYLKQYHDKIKMSTVKKLFAAKTEIENLPTSYFEAKPHRAVGFDEVKAAVIPADTHEALKGALKELGVPMYEYDSNNENSRAEVTQKAINTEYVDKNGEKRSDLRFSKDDTIDSNDKKITAGMSDSERAEILNNKSIEKVTFDYDKAKDFDLDYIENNIKSIVEKPLLEKLGKLGAFKNYKANNIDIDFSFTRNGMKKSLHSQEIYYGGSKSDLVKIILSLDELLDKAVLIESHFDKAKGTPKENKRLKQVFVLLNVLEDENNTIPVQFEIKQFIDNNNRLYLAVALTSFKTEEEISVKANTAQEKNQVRTKLGLSPEISIPELISKINIRDRNFLKYIPNVLLTKEQINAKNLAIEEENKKYGRTDYYDEDFSDISEIKLAVDDTIIDYLAEEYGKPKSRADFQKIIEENPNAAILMMYRNSIETAQKGLYLSESIKLPEESYRKIARKVLIDMGVKVNNYGSAVGRLAESIKHIVEKTEEVAKARVVSGPGYFRNLFENFAKACSDYVKLSSRYNENYRKNVRDYVNGLISNNVLVVRDDDIELIKKNYGSVTEFRSRMNGKTKVGMAKNGRTGYYIEDVADWVYKKYPKLVKATRDKDGVWHWIDKDGGFRWFDMLVNDYLEPKLDTRVESSTVKGYYEDRQSAGFEAALNAINCVLREKVKVGVNEKRIERSLVKELDNEAEQSTNELKELKWAKYRIEELRKRNRKLNAELNKGMSAIREEYYEARMKTVERNKLIRKLNKFIKLFENGKSSKNYVPDVLQKPILDVLKMIEMNAGTYKNGKQKSTPKSFDRYTQKVSDIDRAVTELTEKYETLKEKQVSYSNDVEFSLFDINTLGFEEETLEMLKTLQEQVKGKNIYELSAEDLRTIYDTINELDGALKRAVEVIIDGKKTTVQEAALKAVEEIGGLKVKKGGSGIKGTVQMLSNQAVISSLDPERFSRYISGYHDDYVIRKIINELHNGEKKVQRIKQAGYIKVTSVLSKYSNKDVKHLQRGDVIDFDFTDIDTNKRVKVSPSMLMGIYLTVKQEDGLRHIINDDPNRYLSLPDLDLLNKNNPISDLRQDNRRAVESERHRVRLTEDDISHINNYIETNAMLKELCSAIMVVFNEQIATEINYVSLQTQGRKIAVVKNYYPLSVDPDCPKSKSEWEFTSVFKDQRIKNKGFTKNRTYSILPLRIDDAMSVFSKHISETAEYCGLLIPLTNFMKIYRNGSDTDTVKSIIKKTYGEPAINYINKFIGDLQKSDNTDNNLFLKWQGKYMGAKLLLNPGAAIKQLAAFPTAFNYFGVKNVTAAAAVGMAKIDFDLYAKYTPYLWYRKNGNGTVIGELSREMGFYKKSMDRIDIMGKMDRYVVGCLLYAAELHVEQTTDLKRGTDAFYKEVVRQFEKCVDETQPNNMITSKPQFIRNNVMKLLSLNAFKSQNMAIANSVIDSFGEYNARRAEYKESKTEEAKAAKNEAAKKFAGSAIGAVCSSALIGILTVAVNLFLWHKWDDFKDEEGNVTPLKILQNFTDYSLESLAGCFAWGDKAYEAICAGLDLGKFFGFEVMSVETLNDAISNLTKGKLLEFSSNIIDMFGFPMENILRIARSISSYANDIINGNGEIITENNSLQWENNTSYFNFIIVEAKQKGETEKAEHFEQLWKDDLINKQGKTENQANDTIKTKLVTALAASDDDVEQAALAKANGDLKSYEEHMNKVVGYGFDSVDVKKAVDKFIKNVADDIKNRGLEEKSDIISDLKNQGFSDNGAEYVYKAVKSGESSENEEKMSAFSDTSEGEGVAYTYSDAFEYLKNGDRENYERIEQYLIDNSDKTKKDVQSAMRSVSRTDELWKAYFEAQGTLSGGGDPVKLEVYKKILTNIYDSWSTATTYGRKYQERMKKKEREKNK